MAHLFYVLIKPVVIAMVLLCATIAYCKPPIFVNNYGDAHTLSKDLSMNIVVIFSADWCSYCHKQIDEISLNLDQVNDTIFCILDFNKDIELITKYKVKKLPTTIIIKQGLVIYEHTGYMPLDQLVKRSKQ